MSDIQTEVENIKYLLDMPIPNNHNVVFRPYLPNDLLEVKTQFWISFQEAMKKRLMILESGVDTADAIDRFCFFMLAQGYVTTYEKE